MKDGNMERVADSRYATIFAMLDSAQGAEEVLGVLDAAFEDPKELSVSTPPYDQGCT